LYMEIDLLKLYTKSFADEKEAVIRKEVAHTLKLPVKVIDDLVGVMKNRIELLAALEECKDGIIKTLAERNDEPEEVKL